MHLLQLKNVSKKFPAKKNFFGKPISFVHALHDVSLNVKEGEVVGLVGESGCGKTTLGRTALKLVEPDSGHLFFKQEDYTHYSPKKMRGLRAQMQMVFQDPYASLNPRMTVGNAVLEPLLVHKKANKKAGQKIVEELFLKVGLRADQIQKYPHEFSGGQRQRVVIARALALKPKLIIADEPVSALDVSIQAQIINLLSDLREEFNLSMIFIAHDLKVVEHLSDRIVIMYLGRVMEEIEARDLQKVKHPYSLSLLSAIPIPNPEAKKTRIILKGDVPSPINPPSGCVFHTRCPIAVDRCKKEIPILREIAPGQKAACHLV